MAIKRPLQNLTTFSMSSMTDVIFLLLIFFMVTSTLVFPTALDVNLPQSGEPRSTSPPTASTTSWPTATTLPSRVRRAL